MRRYGECGKKLQTYWFDASVRSCGKVWEMRLEVCDVLGSLSCILEAGGIRSTFYKTCLGTYVRDEVRPDVGSLIQGG